MVVDRHRPFAGGTAKTLTTVININLDLRRGLLQHHIAHTPRTSEAENPTVQFRVTHGPKATPPTSDPEEPIPEVVAVAVLGAPSSPAHLAEGILGDVDRDAALSSVLLGGRTFTIRRELFADLEGHRLTETLGALRRALLVMHSPVDKVVSVDHAREIFQAAKHPKSFVALDGADHLLLERPLDADFAASMLATWAARYIPADEPPARDARGLDSRTEKSPLPEGVVEVESVDGARFAQRVRTRGHVLKTDEPASFGGADSGPAPYEMLLAGLGSCISMTLRIVADREEIPLESVRVRLRHARVHAQDCAECETKKGRIDRIEKELWLDGPLDQAQRQRLLKVSSRCPVHRTLTSETQIVAVDEIGAGEG